MHEGVEHESDCEVGVGVLAVGQVGQEEHGGVVVHVQRGDLPERGGTQTDGRCHILRRSMMAYSGSEILPPWLKISVGTLKCKNTNVDIDRPGLR